MQDEARIGEIIRAHPHLTAALEAARDIAAPDWLVSAGAIRDAVWDALQGRTPVPPRDVDLSFFDPGDLTAERDAAVTAALREREPALRWDAANQAAVHLWYPDRFGIEVGAFGSCADAVATFPETASCVGVRLRADGSLLVVAPYGLGDLLGGDLPAQPGTRPRGAVSPARRGEGLARPVAASGLQVRLGRKAESGGRARRLAHLGPLRMAEFAIRTSSWRVVLASIV